MTALFTLFALFAPCLLVACPMPVRGPFCNHLSTVSIKVQWQPWRMRRIPNS